ncbi:MAG: GFA family protein [Paracoccaceae bacterium]
MSDAVTGRCFCGAVEIEVEGEPAAQGYCHCVDCREWSAGPLNAFSLWQPDAVSVTKGEDKLKGYERTEASDRRFCVECGGHVMTRHPGMGLIDVYPAVLSGFSHAPALHVFYGERMMDVPDDLPKFKDLPSEFGGTGQTVDG